MDKKTFRKDGQPDGRSGRKIKRKPSLKLQRTIAAIPKAKSLYEASQMGGYAPTSKQIYKDNNKQHIRGYLANHPEFSLNACAERINQIGKKAEDKQDYSNALRANEDLIRLQGGFQDNLKVEGEVIHSEEETQEIECMQERLKLLEVRTLNDKNVA